MPISVSNSHLKNKTFRHTSLYKMHVEGIFFKRNGQDLEAVLSD